MKRMFIGAAALLALSAAGAAQAQEVYLRCKIETISDDGVSQKVDTYYFNPSTNDIGGVRSDDASLYSYCYSANRTCSVTQYAVSFTQTNPNGYRTSFLISRIDGRYSGGDSVSMRASGVCDPIDRPGPAETRF